MTQHMLIVLMATMVATFSGLIGCTGKGAAKRGDSGARGTGHTRSNGSSGQHTASGLT
jgi:hypothetical protein